MNEDEHGITPPNVTAMTIQKDDAGLWWVTIEQGNGDLIKEIRLTDMERYALTSILEFDGIEHIDFVDVTR